MTAPIRVMLCDDSLVARGALARLLAVDPAIRVVAQAPDGSQAIATLDAMAAADRPDVVLLDLEMPVMDGLEATRRITALNTGVPVIGLTAHALEEERARCRDAGMVAHVAKPVEIDELVAALQRCARPF